METEIQLNTPQPARNVNFTDLLLISIFIIGFITSFAGGFFLKGLLATETQIKPQLQPTPSPSSKFTSTSENTSLGDIQATTNFQPGDYYFDDTIMILTKDSPHKALVATATRNGKDNDYLQNVRVSFFDGTAWTRKINSVKTTNSAIVSTALLKNWQVDIDPSRVLKQSISGEITINNSDISFSTGVLFNEIATRSLPGYTKFISQKPGKVTIDNQTYDAYYLYTRIYSLNAKEIQFYDQPFSITTDWIAFWSEDGNFYHIDKTSVPNPTDMYQTHEIGIAEDMSQTVSKVFQVSITKNSVDSPDDYSVILGNPIADRLTFKRINMINKAPNNSYIWQMGITEGTVTSQTGQNIKGIGLVEYINN